MVFWTKLANFVRIRIADIVIGLLFLFRVNQTSRQTQQRVLCVQNIFDSILLAQIFFPPCQPKIFKSHGTKVTLPGPVSVRCSGWHTAPYWRPWSNSNCIKILFRWYKIANILKRCSTEQIPNYYFDQWKLIESQDSSYHSNSWLNLKTLSTFSIRCTSFIQYFDIWYFIKFSNIKIK